MSDPLDPFRIVPAIPDVLRRAHRKPDWTKVHLPEGELTQATSINDIVELAARARTSIGNAIMRDGDRVTGAGVFVDMTAGTVTLDTGEIYVQGEVRKVQAAVLNGVAMTGDRSIGVRVESTVVTHLEDPDLLGLLEGTAAHGEPGPIAEVQTIVWGWDGDGQAGSLVPVYRLIDGVIIDQTRPADLSIATQQLRSFTEKTLGNYITDGFRLFALGKVGDAQVFSLEAGSAYVRGQDITRFQSMRLDEVEDPDTGKVDAEPHTFDDAGTGTATLTLRRPPAQSISSVIVTKQTTETLSRGSGPSDTLGNDSVMRIVSVDQGATNYDGEADYYQDGDAINWAPGGDEPALGSSYTVTYLYLDAVAVDTFDNTTLTISGGVTGELALVSYFFKLPRIDRLCIGSDGLPVYLKGQSSAVNPMPPVVPDVLLQIATITNSWFGTPDVDADGTRNITVEEQHRYNRALLGALDLIGLERLDRDIDRREPVAKRGTFVDPFTSNLYRDAGEPQTAAVFDGGMELPIVAEFRDIALLDVATLAYTDEIVIRQDLSSDCLEVNPYQVFTPPPASMALSPSMDFWEINETAFDPDVTRTFGTGNRSAVQSIATEDLGTTQREARFLRTIPVQFTIEGMGGGENLVALDFDGVSVMPAGLTADTQGNLTGTFNIPAGITTGTKEVSAVGQGGSRAAASFVGQGTIRTQTLRRVTTIRRWNDPPPRNWRGNDEGGDGGRDPLAQSFELPADRMVTGVDFQFCEVGDRANPVIIELVETVEHVPTRNVLAQCEVDMSDVVVGQWTQARLAVPVFLPANVPYAWKFLTNDADHAVRIATRGDFDNQGQSFVGAQPYTSGVLFSASLDGAWLPHHNSDMTIRIHAAVFDPTTRVIELGTFENVTDVSDLIIRAGVDLPTGDARCVFEIEFDDASVSTVEAGQPLRLDAYYSGSLQLRAVLTGTREISPILFPNPLLVLGTLQETGTYISRAMTMGEAIRLTLWVKTLLPTGSTLTVEYDRADGVWEAFNPGAIDQIQFGWQDRQFQADPVTATTGRLRLTLTGNPAARPVLSDLRTASI
ncbi:MAG: DUF4815 domain-containing protein [Pseudomonadota bacterium]